MKKVKILLVFSLCIISFFALNVSANALECGDINGDGIVSTADSILVLRYSAGLEALDNEHVDAADIVHDGIVDSKDALEILRIATGLIEPPSHKYSEWEVINKPTCTSEGTMVCYCTVCGEEFFGLIPPSEHNIVNGTCTKCGYTPYKPCATYNGFTLTFGTSPADVAEKLGAPNDILSDVTDEEQNVLIYIYCDDYSNLGVFTFFDNELTQFYTNSFDAGVSLGGVGYELEDAVVSTTSILIGYEVIVDPFVDEHADDGRYVYSFLATSGESYDFSNHTNRETSQKLVFHLTNGLRALHGSEALVYCPCASDVAYKHSLDMAVRDYFDHYTPEGKSPGDRLDDGGIDYYGYGENIAAGYYSAYDVNDGWYNSPGHRSNLLSPQHMYLGVGIATVPSSSYRYYSTQNFYTYY